MLGLGPTVSLAISRASAMVSARLRPMRLVVVGSPPTRIASPRWSRAWAAQYRTVNGCDAVVGVGVAVERPVPGIVGVPLLVAVVRSRVCRVVSAKPSFHRSMYEGDAPRRTRRAWGGYR